MLSRAEHIVVAILPQPGLVKVSVLVCLQESCLSQLFKCNWDTFSMENGKITVLLLYWGVVACQSLYCKCLLLGVRSWGLHADGCF